MTARELESVVSSTSTRPLRHAFMPWALMGGAESPPAGAVALCGAVRGSDDGRSVGTHHPDACLVCVDLLRARA